MSTLDSRTLIEEADEIREQIEANEADEIDRERLAAIEALAEEIGEEWVHGAFLVPEDEFEDHARDVAEETGAIESDTQWPATCIDWGRAADELRMDYTSVTFDGVDYLVRP